ncbi:MAG: hypothetical protein M3384_19715 [Acidobacteriota bacterium]|nr:hypothetical protein [Acidobacteriota bacterium]
MKLKIFIAVPVIALAAFIAVSQIKNRPFAPAEDFPREALVYVQISDLPALARLWNESGFREKYLASENFHDFQTHHLGLKLHSRWQEFNEAAGFPVDLETVSALAQNKAAIALYDVGKLEFVFIAPISDEIFAASLFARNQANFEAQTLDDETTIYRKNVEADRGRQKQELIFTNAKGRFVLATSEKLLAQTLNNINGGGKSAKNRLSDEPSFKALSERTAAQQTATVWVNQAALNKDYYFNRYWLMSEVESLANIRAGIFDFSLEEGKLTERRKFLLNQPPPNQPAVIKSVQILAHLPENVPFYRLRGADNQTLDGAIRDTIFDARKDSANDETDSRHYASYDYYDSSSVDYRSLNENFDETIDETEAETDTIETSEAVADLSKLLQSARPQTVLTFTEPRLLPAPLFAEFRRAAIFNLASPGDFDRDAFESAIEKNISARVLISAPDVKLRWETKSENSATWRELRLPMLGWEISYATRGDDLILTNASDFLREIAATENPAKNQAPGSSSPPPPLTELTVLNLERKEEAYSRIFSALGRKNAAGAFFTGNVESLLDSLSEVGKIEIKKYYSGGFLEEEITMILKPREPEKEN